ncbi:hypothetical protein MKW92_006775, partial [Papaver armeniacum]
MEKKFNEPLKQQSITSFTSLHGYTENGSPTYLSSGNPLLDFFFHVVPDTPSDSVIKRIELAWDYDSLQALKLLCNLRGVRGTGKSDKEGFYAAAVWLFQHHPKTLAANVKSFAEFGYFKDLPEILHRITEQGQEEEELEIWVKKRKDMCCTYETWRKELEFIQKIPREDRIQEDLKRGQMVKEKMSMLQEERRIKRAKRVIERYNGDENYRLLHDQISDVFAEYLVEDLKILNEGKSYGISFAAKWCPSLYLCYDQSTLLCESIARRIFPRESYPEYENVDEAHYAYRIRYRLRKEVLVPLHNALKLPELYMCANKWDSLPYNRVPSVAMTNYKEIFMKHDKERSEDENDCNVAELQWKQMVEDLSKIGKLTDCLAIADVSASMKGTPMDVAVALGLLISEMSHEPWKGKLITFSEIPQLQKIKGDTLRSKTRFIKNMHWGASTDFQKVFDKILQVAVDGNLKEDQMIKRLFVFSDMEFNEANTGKYYDPCKDWGYHLSRISNDPAKEWETDYQVIQNKFREKGYMNVPEIVFWNLRESQSTPGSDFSDFTPLSVMEKAISGEEYNKLV